MCPREALVYQVPLAGGDPNSESPWCPPPSHRTLTLNSWTVLARATKQQWPNFIADTNNEDTTWPCA